MSAALSESSDDDSAPDYGAASHQMRFDSSGDISQKHAHKRKHESPGSHETTSSLSMRTKKHKKILYKDNFDDVGASDYPIGGHMQHFNDASSLSDNEDKKLDTSDSDRERTPRASFSNYKSDQGSTTGISPSMQSSKAFKMLKNLGYEDGKGLGKLGQGRVHPVEASTHRGKMGIGFHSYSKGKEYTGPTWDETMEDICAKETPIWMEESFGDQIDSDVLEGWMVKGEKKMEIDNEVLFCKSEILQDILSLKTAFDKIPPEDLRRIRSTCNPFEKIGKVFFVNRAALKMANLDSVFDFMFTSPRNENNELLVKNNELLYFADVCAGPGGFTEYVLWKKKWYAKGFGFTLKGDNDFKLSELHAAPIESFSPYYGIGDGDVFNPENLKLLKEYILLHTKNQGVHFLMADGGFSVQGNENIQEILSKQLYLCQCIAALSAVREGGSFVVKLFDIFTEFSVGLIYLMYRSFRRICVHKPKTSRPANSERYLICQGKRSHSDTIEKYLLSVNNYLWQNKTRNTDILKLVSLDVMRKDKKFYKYIMNSNESIGTQQKNSLLKVVEFHQNPSKFENFINYPEIAKECLKLWKIPDKLRKVPERASSELEVNYIFDIMSKSCPNLTRDGLERSINIPPKPIENCNDTVVKHIKQNMCSSKDWRFVFLNMSDEESVNVYMRGAGPHVFQYFKVDKKWKPIKDVSIPSGTLFIGERVREYRGESRGALMTWGMHILDAFCLGGDCIADKPLKERYRIIDVFCTALTKPYDSESKNNTITLRCKALYHLVSLPHEIRNLKLMNVKKQGLTETAPVPNSIDNRGLYFAAKSIMLIKTIKDPWTLYTTPEDKILWFNIKTRKTVDTLSPERGNFNAFESMASCWIWSWGVTNEKRKEVIYRLANLNPVQSSLL